MARKLEEIVAVFRQEKQRWDETVLVECDLVGGDMFDSGVTIRTHGRSRRVEIWPFVSLLRCVVCSSQVRQAIPRSHVRSLPTARASRNAAVSDGRTEHRPSVAAKLWKAFAGDAVRILRETPEQAAAAVGGQFTDEKAREASEWLVTQQSMENCTLDLMDLLTGKGFPRSIGKRAVQKWGNKAAEIIRNNPTN